MKTTHHPNAEAFHNYYLHQAGKGYPVYAGRRFQRGHGLGSIIGSLFKSAVPLLKKGAKVLGKEALKTGLNVAHDALQGENVVQSFKKQTKATGKRMLDRVTGPPGERPIKRNARQKKPRRRRTAQQNRPKDIFS